MNQRKLDSTSSSRASAVFSCKRGRSPRRLDVARDRFADGVRLPSSGLHWSPALPPAVIGTRLLRSILPAASGSSNTVAEGRRPGHDCGHGTDKEAPSSGGKHNWPDGRRLLHFLSLTLAFRQEPPLPVSAVHWRCVPEVPRANPTAPSLEMVRAHAPSFAGSQAARVFFWQGSSLKFFSPGFHS